MDLNLNRFCFCPDSLDLNLLLLCKLLELVHSGQEPLRCVLPGGAKHLKALTQREESRSQTKLSDFLEAKHVFSRLLLNDNIMYVLLHPYVTFAVMTAMTAAPASTVTPCHNGAHGFCPCRHPHSPTTCLYGTLCGFSPLYAFKRRT